MCLGAEDWTKEVPRIKQVRDRILGAGEAPNIGRGVGAADWTNLGQKVPCLASFWGSMLVRYDVVVEVFF